MIQKSNLYEPVPENSDFRILYIYNKKNIYKKKIVILSEQVYIVLSLKN